MRPAGSTRWHRERSQHRDRVAFMTARFARIPIRAAGLRLGAQDFRVLICIAAHANGDALARPSQNRIASITGISRSHVADAIARLESAGLLRRNRHRSPRGDWDTSEYEILFHDPAAGVFPPEGTSVFRPEGTGVPSRGTGVFPPEGQGCSLQRDTEQSHRTEPQNIRRAAPCADDDAPIIWFELFWRAYPSRGPHPNPKKPAQQKFLVAIKKDVDPAVIIRGAEAYAGYSASISDRSKVAQAVTWLGQERYRDKVEPARRAMHAGMI
jgi:Helix-turn-helix domain